MFERKSSALGGLFGLIVIGAVSALSFSACTNPNAPAGHEGYVYKNLEFSVRAGTGIL